MKHIRIMWHWFAQTCNNSWCNAVAAIILSTWQFITSAGDKVEEQPEVTAASEEQVAIGEKQAEADLQVVANEESNEEVSQTLILLSYFGDGNKRLSLQLICGRGGGLLLCLVSLAVWSSSFLSSVLCWDFSVVNFYSTVRWGYWYPNAENNSYL